MDKNDALVWKIIQSSGEESGRNPHYVNIAHGVHEFGTRAKWPRRENQADIKLAIRSPRELGFGYSSPITEEIFSPTRLAIYGLKLCQVDVGFRISKVYHPRNKEYLYIAMEPVEIRDDCNGVRPAILVLYFDSGDFGCPVLNLEFTDRIENLKKLGPKTWHHADQFVFEVID